MRIAIVTALWKRPELTRVIQDYYAQHFPDCILIAVKSDDDEQPIHPKWNYTYHSNHWVSQKFNSVFIKAREFNPDLVILVGSDDLITPSLIEFYKKYYPSDSKYMLGLKDLYYYDTKTQTAIHSKGQKYKGSVLPIGCGRVFSRYILDRMAWKPYGGLRCERGLDTNSTLFMQTLGISCKAVTMEEAGAVCVDIKTNECLNSMEVVKKFYGNHEEVPMETLSMFSEQFRIACIISPPPKMKIHVIITTYNRSKMLCELLCDIIVNNSNYEMSVSVFDDGSDYEESCNIVSFLNDMTFNYYRCAKNGGKKKYYELVNKAFADVPDADYYFMIADDMRLAENFFDRAIEIWNSIKSPDKVCLNLDVDGRLGKECWTGIVPKDEGNVYRAQWWDLCGMMSKRFFAEVGIIKVGDRWKLDETLGSGVGAVISRELHRKRLGMYHAKEPLTFHGDHVSMMNPTQKQVA